MERYEKLKVLGVGSFGKVYLVRHRQERKLACAKIIKIKNIPRKERDACRTEVDLLQRLNHPNIVGYKDSFLTPRKEHLCIVMEYCDGGDLSTQIKNARRRLFPESKIFHWFVQIALGLHFMHGRLILHRDLKTQNIFLLGNGRLVLGDLGISKVLEGKMDFASTRIGTPYYMSPELFENKPYNHKSDIWALGCILYEMTALTHAFDATSFQGLAQRVANGRYPPINIKYSRNLRELIARMLSTSPAQRPDLDQILQLGFIRKHIHNFIADIVARETNKMGAGTMVLKTAAVNMIADAEGPSNAPGFGVETGVKVLESNQDMLSLKGQLEELGLQAEVKRALNPPRAIRPANARAAAKVAKEQASALRREEDRRKAVESALARLRKEREDRLRLRRGNENGHLLVLQPPPPPPPARSAKDAAPKHPRVQGGWQAAVVGVGLGVGVGSGGGAPGEEVAGGRRMGGFPDAGGRRGRKAVASVNGSGQSPAVPRSQESRRSLEARDGREEPGSKVPSRPQVRRSSFVVETRKDDAVVGKAAAAGGGRGSGGANRARSNAVDQTDSSRVKDLENFRRAKQAERLAVEAMARREEVMQREAARKREEALRRERERDRLRQDKVELDRKMWERDNRRRQMASARDSARAADRYRVHRHGESRPQMKAAYGGIVIPSGTPLITADSPEAGAAAAVSPPPPPPPAARARARARWVKSPYAAASPAPPSAREVIRQRKEEKLRLEAALKRKEKAGFQEEDGVRGSNNIGARSPPPPSSTVTPPSEKDPPHAAPNGKEEAPSREHVAPTPPRSSSEDSEDPEALQWGGVGKVEDVGNTRISARRNGGDGQTGDGAGFQRRGDLRGAGDGGGGDEADEDLHAREELLEDELRAATNRCEELRYTLEETKSMIPVGALVVVDGSEPLDRGITGAITASPPRPPSARPSLPVVEDDGSEDGDDEEDKYDDENDRSTSVGSSLEESEESRNGGSVRGWNSSRSRPRNDLQNEESGGGPQGGDGGGGKIGIDESGERATHSSEGSYSPGQRGRMFYNRGGRPQNESEPKAPDGAGIANTDARQAKYPRPPSSALAEPPPVRPASHFPSSPVASVPTPSDAVGKETRTTETRENNPASRWLGGGEAAVGRSGESADGGGGGSDDVVTRATRESGEELDSISSRVERRGSPQKARSSAQGELGPPTVGLSPPSPPLSVPTGRLADRIRVLRERCRLGLGTDTFDRAYRYLKAQEEPDTPGGEGAGYFADDDREERLLRGITDIIGQNKIHYYRLVDQLIFIENTYMGSS